MPIVLYRVDERLIHGQVVVGWGRPLHADRTVVVDDELAASDWEQDLYRLGLSTSIEAEFVTVADALGSLQSWRADPRRTMLLVRDIATLLRLTEDSQLRGEEVNLGGVHHAPGRERILPYLYLSAQERGELEEISGRGVTLSAQDLPGSRRVPLEVLLSRG